MTRLVGKRALITGGASGIGLAAAHRFVAEGARVAITGTNRERLEAARRELGGETLALVSDAGDVAAQAGLARTLVEAFGQLDAVFINAGAADFRPLEAWDEAGFDRSFAINVKGPYFLLQALAPHFANPAAVVLNGSVNAHIGMPGSSIYAATKAALISLARTLSGELVGRGVRVNVVSPGPVSTPLYGKLGLSQDALAGMQASLIEQLPVHRFADPDEIAAAVAFLASDDARFAVGTELVLDGGLINL